MITLTREEAQQVLDALRLCTALPTWPSITPVIEALRARLSQCDRCGEVNPAEIHTCTPDPAQYWQEEARRYAENAAYWREKCEAQPEQMLRDTIIYGTAVSKDGKRIDPDSIYKQPEPEPVACPFPCGWKAMLSIIIKDGAFLARGLIEGEPVTGHQREIVMRLIDYAKTMASHGMTTPPQQEGCAECGKKSSDGWALYCVKCIEPVREWVGLTDEERLEILGVGGEAAVLYVTEAKLREKNA